MAKRSDISLDVLLGFLGNEANGGTVKGKDDSGEVEVTLESLMDPDLGIRHMTVLTAAYKSSLGGGSDSDGAVCRHFLMRRTDSGFEILREQISGNSRSTEKDAVRKNLVLVGRMSYPGEDLSVVSISETASGASLWGASSAEDILSAFGVKTSV